VQASPWPGSDLGTGGSDSIRSSWKPLRQAGAAAREMLTTAAAARWEVDRSRCTASHGATIHSPSGRSLNYGELVGDAATLPVPQGSALSDKKNFKSIGQRA